MTYILMRTEDGKYVARPGLKSSYTKDIDKVRIFPTKPEAEKEQCGNEIIKEL